MVLTEFIKTSLRKHLTESNGKEIKYNDNFIKWFGNSKIIENGKPIICYHGANSDIKKFDLNYSGTGNSGGMLQSGNGIYFTDSKNTAERYGSLVKSVFLKMENPLYKSGKVPQNIIDFCLKTYPKLKTLDEYDIKLKIGSIHRILIFLQNQGQDTSKILTNLGYDGIIDSGMTTDYIVFNSNQIKSVENDGSYDINDDNIYS